MSTRRFVRRAAIATAICIPGSFIASSIIAADVAPSGIRQVQYQPGQPAPPSSGVAAELQKMFEESGQPMPSMNPQDLPNAQGQQMQMVRPTGQTARPEQPIQSAAHSSQQPAKSNGSTPPQKSPAPQKRSFLQKFTDSITGNDKRRKQAEAQVVPPVPPGYQNSVKQPAQRPTQTAQAPRTNATGTVTNQNAAANRGSSATAGQNTAPRTANSAQANQNAARATQGNGNGQTGRTGQPKQPVPGIPTAASAGSRTAAGAGSNGVRGTGSATQFVQPGAAPGFMQSKTGKPTVTTAKPRSTAAVHGVIQNSEPPAAPPSEDLFIDPFNESPLVDNETLDLNALVKPRAVETQSDADAVTNADSGNKFLLNDEGLELPTVDAFASTIAPDVTSNARSSASESGSESEDATTPDAVEQNPFTGVTLHESETPAPADMFIPDGQTPPAKDPLESMFREEDGADATSESSAQSEPAIPMHDFGAELPAITLPPVGEENMGVAGEQPVPSPIDLIVPGEKSASETHSPDHAPLVIPSATAVTSSETNPAAGAGTDIEVSAPAPLQSVDAERLQQAAEQERRLRQQRQIVSRTGQSGFKGFCPVALRDRRELVDASGEFTAAFGLQSYNFSSLDAKLAFESDPARYAPAAGGSDVVQLVNGGDERAGSLDYALWHRDRLYLFQSRESMSAFSRDPQRFASQY